MSLLLLNYYLGRILHYYDYIFKTNNFNATHMLRVKSEICEDSNDDYKTLKNVLNYDSDTKLCQENENDYNENISI